MSFLLAGAMGQGAKELAAQESVPTPTPVPTAPTPSDPVAETTEERLARLEALLSTVVDENRRLAEENQRLGTQVQELQTRYPVPPQGSMERVGTFNPERAREEGNPPVPGANRPIEELFPGDSLEEMYSPGVPPLPPGEPEPPGSTSGYDQGFYIQSDDIEKFPYRLVVNFENQFRYTGFARTREFFVNAAGEEEPIPPRNDFEINRGRVLFRGFAVDPKLEYNLTFDFNTVSDNRFTFLQGWLSYQLFENAQVFWGQGKLPGTREWLFSSWVTQGTDRTMATTYFRPSRTTGIWMIGEPRENLFYHVMWGNGFNTGPAGISGLDTNFAYSGSMWWEPLGEFGRLYSDLEEHEDPVVRVGSSLSYSRQSGQQGGSAAPENAAIRLSDGTLLTTPGALGPDVVLQAYSIYLYSADVAWKYRGLSLSGEYFIRSLQDFRTNRPTAPNRATLFDHGFFAQGGYFLIPDRLEVYTRYSLVNGQFGSGSEAGGGLNWWIQGLPNWRFNLDVTKLNSIPAEQNRTGYEAGGTGTLFRAQLQTNF